MRQTMIRGFRKTFKTADEALRYARMHEQRSKCLVEYDYDHETKRYIVVVTQTQSN